MKSLWLLATVFCALMTALFISVVVYYFLHYMPTWRVCGLFAVIAFWVLFTRDFFLKLRQEDPTMPNKLARILWAPLAAVSPLNLLGS